MMYEEEYIEPEFLKRPKKNPFQTPENYFDSIEDRVMMAIEEEGKRKQLSRSGKIYRLLKPALGLAASFALVFVLVYYPIKYFSSEKLVKTETTDTVSNEVNVFYSTAISVIDESSLLDALTSEEEAIQEQINPEEVLAYLSADMNDVEIYSEIQN